MGYGPVMSNISEYFTGLCTHYRKILNKLSAGWLPNPQQQSYNVYATFEDEFGNSTKSQTFKVNVTGQSVLSNETLAVEQVLDRDKPLITLMHNDWNKDYLNVYVEAKDSSSRLYIPTAVKAISDLSEKLKQKSNNPTAWNFQIFTSIGSPSALQILNNSPNVWVQLKHEGDDCKSYLGVAHDENPIYRLLNFRTTAEVYWL